MWIVEALRYITPDFILNGQIRSIQARLNEVPVGDSLRAAYQGMISRRERAMVWRHPSRWHRRGRK